MYDSTLFGVEALIAIAAGEPVLVSINSGVASFLQSKSLDEPVVWDNEGFSQDAEIWTERLIQMITNPKDAYCVAQELRRLILLDDSIASSHLGFLNAIAGLCHRH